jgi:hypothetical protein
MKSITSRPTVICIITTTYILNLKEIAFFPQARADFNQSTTLPKTDNIPTIRITRFRSEHIIFTSPERAKYKSNGRQAVVRNK